MCSNKSEKGIRSRLNRGTISVRDYQLDHVVRLIQILQSSLCYLDTSKTGLGKTYMTIAVAMYYKKKMMVIGPKNSEGVWRNAVKASGAKMVDFISKDALRSRDGIQPKHGYLERYNDGRETQFLVTDKFKSFVDKGGFLVIDECHHVRNMTSDQHRAVRALTSYIAWEVKSTSRFALLSATPLSKIDQIISMMRIMGYIRSEKLFKKHRDGSVILYGLQDLVDVCNAIDSDKTSGILDKVLFYNSRVAKQIVRKLFREVIKNHVSSAVKPPEISILVDQKNGYYNLDDKLRNRFFESLEHLELASKYDRITGIIKEDCLIKSPKPKYNVITERRKIEMYKVPIFDRLARETLSADKNNKVIIGVHFLDTLEVLEDSLREYDPIILKGSVNGKDKKSGMLRRDLLVNQFQNDPEKRVIIAILRVISESISLHDTSGDKPRFKFFSPSFDLLEMYQACGRAVRDGKSTKSNVVIRFVYVKEGEIERHIYDALARKSEILKDTLVCLDGVHLPSDFEDYEEK